MTAPVEIKSVHTVPDLLLRRVQTSGSAVAYRWRDKDLKLQHRSWMEVWTAIDSMRSALCQQGLRSGERIGIAAPVSFEWEVVHLASLSLGLVVVGLDAHDVAHRIARQIELAEVSALVLADPRLLHALPPARMAQVKLVLGVGFDSSAALDPRILTFEALMAGDNPPAALPFPAPTDPATVIFTSGTTGEPKGILYDHRQLTLAVKTIVDAYPFVGTGSQLLCWLPLSNLFQRVVNLAGMASGATSFLLQDPRRVMEVLPEAAPDVFIAVPRFYEKLLAGIRGQINALPGWQRHLISRAKRTGAETAKRSEKGQPLGYWVAIKLAIYERLVFRRLRGVMGPRVRALVSGSAPLPRELIDELASLGLPVLEAYGMSENIVPMAMSRVDGYRFGSVGRPVEPNEISFCADGRIRVRGPGVFHGYLGDSSRVLDDDGFYTSSDVGHLDAEGFLWLTGREGEIVKTSTGRRVALAPIEARLRSVPGIDQAQVIGRSRKALTAVCTISQEIGSGRAEEARLEALLSHCIRGLPAHERPLGVLIRRQPFSIERGELTPNLKLRRNAIENAEAQQIRDLYVQLDKEVETADPVYVWI